MWAHEGGFGGVGIRAGLLVGSLFGELATLRHYVIRQAYRPIPHLPLACSLVPGGSHGSYFAAARRRRLQFLCIISCLSILPPSTSLHPQSTRPRRSREQKSDADQQRERTLFFYTQLAHPAVFMLSFSSQRGSPIASRRRRAGRTEGRHDGPCYQYGKWRGPSPY